MDSLIYESGLFIPEPHGEIELAPCPICKRTFAPATLEKHIGICQKMQTKKRTIFDSSQMRREGTELEKYMPPTKPNASSSVHKWLESRVSPPRTTPKLSKKTPEPKGSSSIGRQERSGSNTSSVSDFTRKRAISKEPPSEECPYCHRNFGNRAFDRHVSWCKEKAILKAHEGQANKDPVATERLQARINYRAPLLRTKRGMTRDRYSPFDDNFMKSFVHNKKALSEAGRSYCNSMASSVISDGGFSDKYDPFMSAKRQLEELFSPNPRDSKSPSKERSPPLRTRPQKTLASPEPVFQRSMSLRLPKKTPIKKMTPSTVQTGITDDAPISSNFIKPEQYDEIPVRSVYSTLASNRDLSPGPAILRDPETIPNRKNAKVSVGSGEYPISKTDSLAAFLHYEQNLGVSSPSEKDLKDSNNILNQKSSMKSVSECGSYEEGDHDEEEFEEKVPEKVNDPEQEETKNQDESLRSYVKSFLGQNEPGKENITTSTPVALSRSSSDRKVTLKRQMKLQLDNILYDKCSSANEEEENNYQLGNDNVDRGNTPEPNTGKKSAPQTPMDKYFDNFDLEEFIASFEDDEQNPIFKSYKDMVQKSRSQLDNSFDPYDQEEQAASTDSSYGSLTHQSTPEKEAQQYKEKAAQSEPKPVKMSRFCYQCGNEFLAQAKFCIECGVKRVVLE